MPSFLLFFFVVVGKMITNTALYFFHREINQGIMLQNCEWNCYFLPENNIPTGCRD